jgi:hypothetical protein
MLRNLDLHGTFEPNRNAPRNKRHFLIIISVLYYCVIANMKEVNEK